MKNSNPTLGANLKTKHELLLFCLKTFKNWNKAFNVIQKRQINKCKVNNDIKKVFRREEDFSQTVPLEIFVWSGRHVVRLLVCALFGDVTELSCYNFDWLINQRHYPSDGRSVNAKMRARFLLAAVAQCDRAQINIQLDAAFALRCTNRTAIFVSSSHFRRYSFDE